MDDIRERMCNNYCGFGVKFGAGKDIACKHCPLNELPKCFHDNLTNCPLEQDAPSASELRGEEYWADQGDEE